MQDKIRTILAENTGQDYDKIARDTDRDYYMSADQAVDYALVDEILGAKSDDSGNGSGKDSDNGSGEDSGNDSGKTEESESS